MRMSLQAGFITTGSWRDRSAKQGRCCWSNEIPDLSAFGGLSGKGHRGWSRGHPPLAFLIPKAMARNETVQTSIENEITIDQTHLRRELIVKHVIPILFALCCVVLAPARAQYFQEEGKLVGTGAVGLPVYQGRSVSISADGNTAIVGGYWDNNFMGAAWVYTRNAGVWTQQGGKLVGTGSVGSNVQQGVSVAISGDGNTAIVGGFMDNGGTGAAWVYTRIGGVWSQQGAKLVSTGWEHGWSVSISHDGNTAIVSGWTITGLPAAWVYSRNGGVWTQQGPEVVATEAVVTLPQYCNVSLSADGNTAILGSPSDNSNDNGPVGAAWVFTRNAGVWTQQGGKLVATDTVGSANQGCSVSLSADGNTALVGGEWDNAGAGAAWVYTRSGDVWTQQGSKLVGTGAVGTQAHQGASVSLSADGNTIVVGGWYDDTAVGAAWVYVRSGNAWIQKGSKLVRSGATFAWQGRSVSVSADGSEIIVGAPLDSYYLGAAWVYYGGTTTSSIMVQDGWNMVSVPVLLVDSRKSTLYPTAASAAFTYSSGYQKEDTLIPGGGYWVKFSDSGTVQYSGTPIAAETINVHAGWNMIGSISTPVPATSVTSIPGGVSTSVFYGYSGGYSISDSIQPGNAYWVRVNADCKLVLSSSSGSPEAASSSRIRIVAGSELPPPPPERGMAEGQQRLPKAFSLDQNYPNPFNPSTIINYQLPMNSHVTLKLYDLLGQEVKTLVDEMQDAGYRSVELNAHELASGMYYYRLVAGSFSQTRKMLLVR